LRTQHTLFFQFGALAETNTSRPASRAAAAAADGLNEQFDDDLEDDFKHDDEEDNHVHVARAVPARPGTAAGHRAASNSHGGGEENKSDEDEYVFRQHPQRKQQSAEQDAIQGTDPNI